MSYPIESTSPVKQMIGLEITGNVIPMAWFQTIRMPSGKPDTVAIMLLSDVVYWYRPTEVRDEKKGSVSGFRKKFKGEKLQRSYSSFVNQYGFTKDQVRDAFNRLETAGILKITHETVRLPERALGNVMFIDLIFEGLKSHTYPTLSDYVPIPLGIESNTLLDLNPIGGGIESDTYTETTPEITTENSTQGSLSPGESPPAPKSRAAGNNKIYPIAMAIAKVTKSDMKLLSDQVYREAKILARADICPDDILQVFDEGGVWYEKDWRGKKGQAPSISQIRQTITAYLRKSNDPDKPFSTNNGEVSL